MTNLGIIRNCSYVAAWSSEIGRDPVYRKIVGDHILLFRGPDGMLIALDDTCPHRFAPLHRGTIVGATIECPYHGLRTDAQGKCVHNPHDPKVKPEAARRRVYPVVERDSLSWIWMGAPDKANPATIPPGRHQFS